MPVFRNWSLTRWIRLGIALSFLAQGIASGTFVAFAAATFFGLQAALNFGCCGTNACRSVGSRHADTRSEGPITYEELR